MGGVGLVLLVILGFAQFSALCDLPELELFEQPLDAARFIWLQGSGAVVENILGGGHGEGDGVGLVLGFNQAAELDDAVDVVAGLAEFFVLPEHEFEVEVGQLNCNQFFNCLG